MVREGEQWAAAHSFTFDRLTACLALTRLERKRRCDYHAVSLRRAASRQSYVTLFNYAGKQRTLLSSPLQSNGLAVSEGHIWGRKISNNASELMRLQFR